MALDPNDVINTKDDMRSSLETEIQRLKGLKTLPQITPAQQAVIDREIINLQQELSVFNLKALKDTAIKVRVPALTPEEENHLRVIMQDLADAIDDQARLRAVLAWIDDFSAILK